MKTIIKPKFAVLLFSVFLIRTVQMGATVKFTNAICDSKNTTWVTFDLCRLRAISRNKTVLNVYTNILYPAYNVHLNFQMQKRANGYKPWMGKHTVDYCAFMRKVNHPVIKIYYNLIKDFTSFNHTCPFVGKQIVKDFFWDPTDFLLPFPSGDYALLLTWMFDKRPQVITKFYFTFRQDLFKD